MLRSLGRTEALILGEGFFLIINYKLLLFDKFRKLKRGVDAAPN